MPAGERDPGLLLRTRVRPRDAGSSLVDFLAQRFRYLDLPAWERAVAQGVVRVDGAAVTASHPLRAGAEISYRRLQPEPPAPTDIPVLHDRDGVVVIDKPAGLPFHADGAFVTRTVIGVLAERLGRLRPVQRLDRETSGLAVLARTRAIARRLQEQLQRGAFEKVYDALAHGRPPLDRWTIVGAVGRDSDSSIAIRRAIVAGGESAETEVEVVARGTDASWLRCRPRTGRTHQIRVHLTAAGHPLLGDKLYGRTDDEFLAWVHHVKAGGDAAWDGRLGAPRQMLHARRLGFLHPDTGAALRFEVEPPQDFLACAAARGMGRPTHDDAPDSSDAPV